MAGQHRGLGTGASAGEAVAGWRRRTVCGREAQWPYLGTKVVHLLERHGRRMPQRVKHDLMLVLLRLCALGAHPPPARGRALQPSPQGSGARPPVRGGCPGRQAAHRKARPRCFARRCWRAAPLSPLRWTPAPSDRGQWTGRSSSRIKFVGCCSQSEGGEVSRRASGTGRRTGSLPGAVTAVKGPSEGGRYGLLWSAALSRRATER